MNTTVLHETNSDNKVFDDAYGDSNQMMLFLFPIIIELFIDDEHSRKSISSCFMFSHIHACQWALRLHMCVFWWWWVYNFDITMIASYPSTLFKRTTKFTFITFLFSYPFQVSLSLLKIFPSLINHVQLSSIYTVLALQSNKSLPFKLEVLSYYHKHLLK